MPHYQHELVIKNHPGDEKGITLTSIHFEARDEKEAKTMVGDRESRLIRMELFRHFESKIIRDEVYLDYHVSVSSLRDSYQLSLQALL